MNNYRRKGSAPNGDGHNSRAVLAQARKKKFFGTRDIESLGIPRAVLTSLCRDGKIKRIGRGFYAHPDADLSEYHALAEVCRRIPHGVICLLTALSYHGLTTQSPPKVWMAVDVKAQKPVSGQTPLRVVRFSGRALTYGVEKHRIEGVTVRVTSAAKTVADCFKYRNKIGVDIAIEALKDYRRSRRSMDKLWRAAKVCRVANVMRPYLEALE